MDPVSACDCIEQYVNSAHLHLLFENDRFFSHLSSLERELSFRTEMVWSSSFAQ